MTMEEAILGLVDHVGKDGVGAVLLGRHGHRQLCVEMPATGVRLIGRHAPSPPSLPPGTSGMLKLRGVEIPLRVLDRIEGLAVEIEPRRELVDKALAEILAIQRRAGFGISLSRDTDMIADALHRLYRGAAKEGADSYQCPDCW